jgi:catechol 2,3-dioxygenase-like lactoylglutathione lyase family enzyme
MDAACRFYEEHLGFPVRFRDGARWATVDAGGVSIALAGGEGRGGTHEIAMNIKVTDVDKALRRAMTGGASCVQEPLRGLHEVRASFRDRDGHLFNIYSPL